MGTDNTLATVRGLDAESVPRRWTRCWLCRRREVDRNVSLSDGRIVGCCDTCWERGEDEIRIPLDMTTDEGDDDA